MNERTWSTDTCLCSIKWTAWIVVFLQQLLRKNLQKKVIRVLHSSWEMISERSGAMFRSQGGSPTW